MEKSSMNNSHKMHELVRLKISTETIKNNMRLLSKLEEKSARRVENNQMTIDKPSLIDIKQLTRRTSK
jgi:hypothetical protein